jgi:hypothetical protein
MEVQKPVDKLLAANAERHQRPMRMALDAMNYRGIKQSEIAPPGVSLARARGAQISKIWGLGKI